MTDPLMLLAALSIATFAFLAVVLLGEVRRIPALVLVGKPAASACFIAAAWLAGALESDYGAAVLLGLVLSWFGDVFLMGKARAPFLAGLVSFLLGHVAYAAAFVIRGLDLTWALAACLPLLISAAIVSRWLLPKVDGGMRAPVIAYILVISVMVALAAGTVGAHGLPLILVAAVSFYASDLFVARERFVTQSSTNRLVGLPLYYAAQIAFAWTLI